MICNRLSEILGFTCHPLTDDGLIAMVDTPFRYPDGDELPVFIEKLGPQIRFFDDGGGLLHLLRRGVSLDDHRKTKFIKSIADPHHVSLNESGELEIWSTEEGAPAAFAHYVSAMLGLSKWESEQVGVSTDLSLFLDEVEVCLRAWKPKSVIGDSPEYKGISGHVYKLHFSLDDDAVLAVNPRHASVSSAAKKLLDIRAVDQYKGLKIIVVMDDRHDRQSARNEARVLDVVGSVIMMSALERQAGFIRLP
ncbi:DUF1828 domain-containing protein [Pseudoduganella sp. FT26W]|uniref:DUF1828 domain-containing protein n=1 Tax=Duganella aquatilis TaxID=2666082 RepID=A0A844DH04_9BURK|nr:DUF1828 domain-containing protein [Duganella aquatilis]MRW87664.1 DUF1828 domain-containing protein [Duganella aquatilis]